MSYPTHQPYGAPYGPVVMTTQPYRSSTAHIVIAWIVAVFTAFYMLPWAIAATRNKSNTVVIAMINLFLGWSLVGWIVALVLSLTSEPVPTTVVVHQPYPAQPYPAQPSPAQAYPPPPAQAPQIAPHQPYAYPPPQAIEPTAILPAPDPWQQTDHRYPYDAR